MLEGKIVVAVACMDSRLYPEDVSFHAKLKEALGADHVFVRTAAGPDGKILSQDHHFSAIVDDVSLIIKAKGATTVAVVAHSDCAGHPVSDAEHETDSIKAAKLLEEKLPSEVKVVPILAKLENTEWSLYRL